MFAKPVGLPSNVRNPFVAVGVEKNDESVAVVEGDERVVGSESEEEPESSVDQAVVTTNPIRDLGLELSATMVGQRSRLATINGKTYEEGEMIPVIIEAGSRPDEVTVLQLQLAHVDRRSVVLRMAGQEHLLQLRNEVPTDAIVVKPRRE
ncbi:MAG: hypothetical protein HYV60_05275 [Planctomycetia bacterium]|nr:hypothetical protein [Planctomycetia bacterium]